LTWAGSCGILIATLKKEKYEMRNAKTGEVRSDFIMSKIARQVEFITRTERCKLSRFLPGVLFASGCDMANVEGILPFGGYTPRQSLVIAKEGQKQGDLYV